MERKRNNQLRFFILLNAAKYSNTAKPPLYGYCLDYSGDSVPLDRAPTDFILDISYCTVQVAISVFCTVYYSLLLTLLLALFFEVVVDGADSEAEDSADEEADGAANGVFVGNVNHDELDDAEH